MLIDELLSGLSAVKTENAPKTSTVVPRYLRLSEELRAMKTEISREHPREVDAAVDLVLENVPKFVLIRNLLKLCESRYV